jgi:hypothetical protein
VNSSAELVDDVPDGVVTVTSTVPPACGGATAVNSLDDATVTLELATEPKSTVVEPSTKLAPATVTEVPPTESPDDGDTLVTLGADSGVTLS